ncbi:sulfite exporter TauE/SafE family protein [Nioella nitratireducens]|uniref:sulfite exporter TauE/SafE family protein n=1 Tax=Nioella nitratireducens TaxID=1287720 RepID=UPI0008FD6062|nr:sulfite exporter TauE/SafE family protein [Nioella nitratireducens]
MIDVLTSLPEGLTAVAFGGLIAVSFVSSFITVSFGIGGGTLLIAMMATLVPPLVLIPVHGVIQLGSNTGRAVLLARHVHWAALPGFVVGAVIGSLLGGMMAVEIPPQFVQIGIGCFVIYSVLSRPPKWLAAWPWLSGGVSSFLTMFFGATGLFVANFIKSMDLPRHRHVATHATLMTVQHALKVIVFGFLGFAFGGWVPFIGAMILSGLVGTVSGRLLLNRMTDHGFKRALNVVLLLISARLIWGGLMG